jgi:hypothetical protein
MESSVREHRDLVLGLRASVPFAIPIIDSSSICDADSRLISVSNGWLRRYDTLSTGRRFISSSPFVKVS